MRYLPAETRLTPPHPPTENQDRQSAESDLYTTNTPAARCVSKVLMEETNSSVSDVGLMMRLRTAAVPYVPYLKVNVRIFSNAKLTCRFPRKYGGGRTMQRGGCRRSEG